MIHCLWRVQLFSFHANMMMSAKSVLSKRFSTTSVINKSYKLVVVGGGAGGCSAAAKFSNKLGKGHVAVIEPEETHYYQPMWTLVGGGLKQLSQSEKPMGKVLPENAEWLKTKAVGFDPDRNLVMTADGEEIGYDFLLVAMGLEIDWDGVKGLREALESSPNVCSNYSWKYVDKTAQSIANFKSGNAVFTFPKPPIKCPGAPQKIAYITERQLTKAGKRQNANVVYFTSLPVLFGVKKYADALWKVVESRNINVSLNKVLIEVKPDTKEVVFEDTSDAAAPHQVVNYEMLHVTPPMGAGSVLKNATKLVDATGFVDVDPHTTQHKKYSNVFSIGDCSNIPTSKTTAAVAAQLGVLRQNLGAAMQGKTLAASYDGYTSCPLVTGPGECILAEFDNSVPPEPMETFPVNQAKPRLTMYQAKANIMPQVYWQMLKGRWEGPKYIRKALHLGLSK